MVDNSDRFFLYIDILGFKSLIQDNQKVDELYQIIDKLNVQTDKDFHTIVFSDTIVVSADSIWNNAPSQAIMWLVEFTQDLFYRLSHKDIHFRALITKGEFTYQKFTHFEAYHGSALVDCYLKEGSIKCCGTFLDNKLAQYSDIFHLSKFDKDVSFVHLMQHLDDVSFQYEDYPISGEYLFATGMEWWVAYLIRYLSIIHGHMTNPALPSDVRTKFVMTWMMISEEHEGLLRRLSEANFDAEKVILADWKEPFKRIGTPDGAWG